MIHQEIHKDGRLILTQSWSENGRLVYFCKYSDSGELKEVAEYYENGERKLKGQVLCLDTIERLDSNSKPMYSIVMMYGNITYWDSQGRITRQMSQNDSAGHFQFLHYDTLGNVTSKEELICK
jgi:antitoxin component YwqK of YwqJK toxin-antitoxin module